MSLLSSTSEKVLAIGCGALLLLSVSFGVLWHIRGNTIEKQEEEISQQKAQLEQYAKDKSAQEVADKQQAAQKKAIAAERDQVKQELKDALKDNTCANTALPDDADRLLDKVYNSEGS